jgi:hypothetical protein
VWLASYPRSGNTWLRTFIGSLLESLHAAAPTGIKLLSRATVWEASADGFQAILGRDPFKVDPRELAKARPRVQMMLATRANGRLFLKTHMAALKVDGEFAINWSVTKGAIYLVRNPLDVACSYAPHYGISIDEAIRRMGTRDLVAWGKSMVREKVGSWSQNVLSWTGQKLPLQPHVMRYEDMVSKPLETFLGFANYVGTGISEERVAEAIELTKFERLKEQEQEQEHEGRRFRPKLSTDAFFRRGKSHQWRDTLTTAQVDGIVADHASMMQRFGYLP